MKLHLPKMLLTAVLAAVCYTPAWGACVLIPDQTYAEGETPTYTTSTTAPEIGAGSIDQAVYQKDESDGKVISNANFHIESGKSIWVASGEVGTTGSATSAKATKPVYVQLNGVITGSGTLKLNEYPGSSSNFVIYELTNSTSTFDGTISLENGYGTHADVQLNLTGTGTAYQNAVVNSNGTAPAIINIGSNVTIGALKGSNSKITSTSAENTLTLNVTDARSNTYSGSLGTGEYHTTTEADNGFDTASSTALNLVKTGAGTQTLTGATNLKDVTVTGGKLVLSGSAKLGSGDLTITGATVEATFSSSAGTSVLGGGATANIGNGGMLKLIGHDMLGWGDASPAKIILGSDDSTALATFEIADTAVCTLKPALEMNGNSRITGTAFNTFGTSLTVTNKNNIISVGEIKLRAVTGVSSFAIDVKENADLEISSTLSGHADGAAAITKKGAGALVFSGTDSVIDKALTVEAGTLEITKEITVKDNVTVNDGATLVIGDLITNAGSGTITLNGNVVINNSDTYELYEASSVSYSAGDNGFRTTIGGKYWLIEGGTVGISNIGSVTLDGTETTTEIIQIETGGAVFSKGTAVTSAEYYVNTTVSSDVHETATYYLNSETAVLNVASSLSNSRIAGAAGAVNVTKGNTLQLDTAADNLKHILTTATGDGDVELSTYVNLQTGDSTSITGNLEILGGGELRLGGEGDDGATNSTPDVSTLNVELNGGKLTARGFQGSLNSVTVNGVTTDQQMAVLYIGDTETTDGIPNSFTIGKLTVNADLNLQTKWKSSLNVDWLTGSKNINFVGLTSDGAGHHLRVNSVNGYTGVITMQNHSVNMGFLTMNIKEDESLNASQIKACNNSSVVIDGAGTYNLGSQTYIAGYSYTPQATEEEPNPTKVTVDKGSFATTWTGTVVLDGATLTDADLNAYGNASSAVELKKVSGSLTEGTINTNVKLTLADNTPGIKINNTTGKTVTFAGAVSGNGNFVVEAANTSADDYKADAYVFSGDVSNWNTADVGFISATDANVEFTGNATTINNGIYANGGTLNATISGDKAVTVNGDVTNKKWSTSTGTLNLTVNNTSTEGVTFTKAVKADTATIAEGSKATFTGTTNLDTISLGAGLSADYAAITTSGALTLGKFELDLTTYTDAGEFLLVSKTGNGSINWTEGSWSQTGLADGLTANVGFNDAGGLSLTISDVVAPDTKSLTTTITGVNGLFDSEKNMLTLNIGADDSLANVGNVTISGISDDIMKVILGLDGLPEDGMVGITLLDKNGVEFIGGIDGSLVFRGNTGEYEGVTNVGSATLYNVAYIPEPTTATLSLLALAGLAMRRRRKA